MCSSDLIYEMQPAAENFIPANVPGGFGRAPYPDVRAFSMRDYGNRVGIFRVIAAFERCGVPATAAVDAGAGSFHLGLLFAVQALFPFLLTTYAGRVADRCD